MSDQQCVHQIHITPTAIHSVYVLLITLTYTYNCNIYILFYLHYRSTVTAAHVHSVYTQYLRLIVYSIYSTSVQMANCISLFQYLYYLCVH